MPQPNLDLYNIPRSATFGVSQKLIFSFDASFSNPRVVILRSNTGNLVEWNISSHTYNPITSRLEIDATPVAPQPPFSPTPIYSRPPEMVPGPGGGGDSDLSITIIDEDATMIPTILTIHNYILYFAIRFVAATVVAGMEPI